MDVEDKINQLELLKVQIRDTVDTKVNSLDVDSKDSIEKILSVVTYSLESDLDQVALENIQGLILEFGDLPVLDDLEEKLRHRIQTAQIIRLLEEAQQLEIELDKELTILQLEEISAKILALPSNAQAILHTKLYSQIISKRAIIEPILCDLLIGIDWLSLKYDVSKTSPDLLKTISETFRSLIQLQNIIGAPQYPETWWGADILLQPVVTRFIYHFNSPNKETNKLSKPEWAFAFVETFLNEKLQTVNRVVGTTFRDVGKVSDYEIITSILKPLREKVLVMVKLINKNFEPEIQSAQESVFTHGFSPDEKFGRLLSHLIFELSSFDQRLKSTHLYNPYLENLKEAPTKKWVGLTADVLVHGTDERTAVTNWLNFERELALKRFKSEILDLSNAYTVDYDFQISHENIQLRGQLKPTYSAFNLVRLIDNLTSHFQTLGVVKYQLKYVSTIHLHLIDEYCDHLNQLYKKRFDSFNQSRVLRAIPGSLNADSTIKAGHLDSGRALVESFTGVYCLAKFMSNAVEEWSLELVFIQLWNVYKGLATKENEYLSIFDSSITQYQTLIKKCISTMEAFFKREIKALIKEYVNTSQWNIPNHDDRLQPSPSINLLTSNLPVYLELLQKAMSRLDYYNLTDGVVSLLSIILLEYLVTNNQFTRTGVKQLRVDIEYITSQLGYLYFDGGEFDNSTNRDYMKLLQSVCVLESVDSGSAKNGRDDIGKFRKGLDFDTGCLRNGDLNDLLMRVL